MLVRTVSVAVIVWPPAVVNVAAKIPVPDDSVLLAGSLVDALWSELENETVPA